MLWDRHTGEPLHGAITWQDTRTDALCTQLARGDQDRYRPPPACRSPRTSRRRRSCGCSTTSTAPRARRGRRPARRHDRQLGRLAPHHGAGQGEFAPPHRLGLRIGGRREHQPAVPAPPRHRQRRPAPHRCHERVPHDAHGSRHARLGPGDPARHRHPPHAAPRDPPVIAGVRRGERRPPRRRPDRRHPRRPAGRDVRTDLLRARRGEEHLRHRQLPAAEHRHDAVRSTHGLITTVGYQLDHHRPPTAWRARSRSPARSCSGFATTWG